MHVPQLDNGEPVGLVRMRAGARIDMGLARRATEAMHAIAEPVRFVVGACDTASVHEDLSGDPQSGF